MILRGLPPHGLSMVRRGRKVFLTKKILAHSDETELLRRGVPRRGRRGSSLPWKWQTCLSLNPS